MNHFIALSYQIKTAVPKLDFQEIIVILQIICKFGQPLLSTVCPIVNSGHDKLLLAQLQGQPGNFSPEP